MVVSMATGTAKSVSSSASAGSVIANAIRFTTNVVDSRVFSFSVALTTLSASAPCGTNGADSDAASSSVSVCSFSPKGFVSIGVAMATATVVSSSIAAADNTLIVFAESSVPPTSVQWFE
jgi:hypothetical protein